MINKMEPTSETVGPSESAKAPTVDRPMSLNLEIQVIRETSCHADFTQIVKTPMRWLTTALRVAFLVFSVLIPCATLNAVEDTYTLEAERAPKVDYYYQEKNRQAASERQEQFRKRVSIQHAVGDDVPRSFAKETVERPKRASTRNRSESEEIFRNGILLVIATVLTSILAVRILAPAFFRNVLNRLKPWSSRTGVATGVADKVRAEDEYFTEFLTAFQAVATAPPAGVGAGCVAVNTAEGERQSFHATAARLLSSQRSLIQNIVSATSDSVRVRMLGDLRRELNEFKNESVSPEFLPAWQMASALEGLLKQLTDKAGNATQSTLRTVASGIQLLGELSKRGVRRDILTQPPMRFLAVDDDMISRTAVALALKKVFNQPDLADNGTVALALAAKNEYDVIFLDVQMPGMDGYEVCSKIHETPANKQTPVIFVTCMNDFDARAKSVLANGSDLIGKPFLTFEITVKALTLALERRLKADAQVVTGSDVIVSAITPSPESDASEVSEGLSNKQSVAPEREVEASVRESDDEILGVIESRDSMENAFMTRVATKLVLLKDLIRSTSETKDQITRQETLAEFYLGLHELSSEVDSDVNQSARQMKAALEGLVRKLLESPDNWTPSMLLTITNAVDLLDELCAWGSNPDLVGNAPIKILAVDDDPISRRAMSGALQVAFKKPVSAESGQAALQIASQQKFDLIFMDVQMPGMDGFETCSKFRETETNARTPVVFVTSTNDSITRSRVADSGGDGVISKPFLTAELTVKALTSALRGRIELNDLHRTKPFDPENAATHPVTA